MNPQSGSSQSQEYPSVDNLALVYPKSPLGFLALLCCFSAIFVFASNDRYNATPLTLYLNDLFISGRIETGSYISVFEVFVLVFSMTLLWKFGARFGSAPRLLRVLFLIALLCWILNMLNPNDRSSVKILGLPLLSEFQAYPYLLFMFAVFFMKTEHFTVYSLELFQVVSFFVVLRAAILLLLWSQGKGNSMFFGVNATLTEGDSLLIFAFFQSVFFALFLFQPKPAVFLGWILTLLIQVLSYRRTALYVAVITNVMTLMGYLFLGPRGRRWLILMLGIVSLGLVYYSTTSFGISSETLDDYMARYLGVFNSSNPYSYAGDSGHSLESSSTLSYALQKMDFWGLGYGDESRINVPGATQDMFIHNVYAAAWVYRGIHMFLFYVLLFCIGIVSLLLLLMRRARYDWATVLIVGAILSYFFLLTVVWFFNPLAIAEGLRMRILWVYILAFVFRATRQNYAQLTPSG